MNNKRNKFKNFEEYIETIEKSNSEELKELAMYDFTNDEASENYINLDQDNIEKALVYMALWRESNFTKECQKKGYKSNPDSERYSTILQEVFKILWNGENLEECLNSTNIILGDTMNSLNTTLKVLYEKCIETEERKKEREITTKYILNEYSKKKENIKNKLKNVKGLENFLKMYHTLGNYLPFPVGCNSQKGIQPLNDYMDLTLKHIYDYYKRKEKHNIDTVFTEEIIKIIHIINDSKISEIVGSKRNTISSDIFITFGKWLDSFKDWNGFVEKNYLQSFVESNQNKYGKPKELWIGHFTGEVLPENLEQCQEYFTNASKWIEERGKQMIVTIKKHI